MPLYFPYSHIISRPGGENAVKKHPFFGEWEVSETKSHSTAQVKALEISEIYY